jgi:threonine/homoserine/homoserine lactone efflux protein
MIVKLAGAAYLVWLGISLFRAKVAGSGDLPAMQSKSSRQAFLESVIVEVFNPKTALFFMAFLPQFIDAAAVFPVWLQFVILGTIVNMMFSSADIVCVLLAGAMMSRLRRSGRMQQLMQRAGGSVLVGLGAHLALQKS